MSGSVLEEPELSYALQANSTTSHQVYGSPEKLWVIERFAERTRATKTTICGTDLHILKGDVQTCIAGTILGHDGVGVIDTDGIPASFELCEAIVAAGGTIANVGVHGVKEL